jgi:hypothetical protein
MIDFRGRTCGECAWLRSVTTKDYYGKDTKYNCINAACRLAGIGVPKNSEACPAFVPLIEEVAETNRNITESENE